MSASTSDMPYRAILTGATGGIGKAIARELIGHAEWLILVGRNIDALTALQRELGAVKAHIVHGDLANEETVRAIETLANRLGGVNLLINNAGTSDFHAFETQDAGAIIGMLQTNLLVPMLLTRRLLPLLRRAPQAQVVNVGSVFGSMGYPGFAAYCASKAGLKGFTQALRRELSDTGVKVRYFAPRVTTTAINSAQVIAMNKALKVGEDSPEHVARQFLHFLGGRAWATTLGAKESFFVFVNSLLPSMPDKAILGQLPIIRKYLPK